jgi:hypothetical protein
MKRKAEHPTSNGAGRMRRYKRVPGSEKGDAEHPTSNIQHPTSNEEKRKRRFDLEERMLSHAARSAALYDSMPVGSGARQIGNQLYQSVRTTRQQNASSARVREDAADSPDWMLDVGCWMLDVNSEASL